MRLREGDGVSPELDPGLHPAGCGCGVLGLTVGLDSEQLSPCSGVALGQCWGPGGAVLGRRWGPREPGVFSLMGPNVQGLGDAPSTDWCGPTGPEPGIKPRPV